MAIVYDADLGTNGVVASATTIALTTSAAAAAGSRIILSVSWINLNPVIDTVAGGGLTWVVDRQLKASDNINNVGIVSADAPAGLASSTVITVTLSAAAVYRSICADSFTGITGGASGYEDTDVANDMVATTTAWTTGNVVTTQSDLIYAAAFGDGNNSTNTPTAPSIETHDFHIPGNTETILATEYRIETSASTYTVAGTFSVGSAGRLPVVGVAYLAEAGVTPGPADNPPIGILGRGAGW